MFRKLQIITFQLSTQYTRNPVKDKQKFDDIFATIEQSGYSCMSLTGMIFAQISATCVLSVTLIFGFA